LIDVHPAPNAISVGASEPCWNNGARIGSLSLGTGDCVDIVQSVRLSAPPSLIAAPPLSHREIWPGRLRSQAALAAPCRV